MDLKLYLNKFLKVDNIEQYSMKFLLALKESYDRFLEKGEGKDPDFPLMTFGDKANSSGGIFKADNNRYSVENSIGGVEDNK